MEPGHVYFVATPMGNLMDMSHRAIEVLKSVDVLCCEDTRHTMTLLRHFQVPRKTLVSHHAHNTQETVPRLLEMASQGQSIGVVSDAGTPGISDPGTELAAALGSAGIPVHPIPGACAVSAAVSISGFPCNPFTFYGFPPSKGSSRQTFLDQVINTPHTSVLYESPHRIVSTLEALVAGGPQTAQRRLVLCREMTKVSTHATRTH